MPASRSSTRRTPLRFLPEIILTVMGTLLMVLDPVIHKRSSNAFGHLSLLALVGRARRRGLRLHASPDRRSAAC